MRARNIPGLGPPPPLSCKITDRKSTRLNFSHLVISYAVFCLKNEAIGEHLLLGADDDGVSSAHFSERILEDGDAAAGQRAEQIFFFNDTATTEIYTLSLHDALPI